MERSLRFTFLFAAVVAFSATSVLAQGTITTIAGGGTSTADDVPALTASFSTPSGVVTDASGNLYIADRNHHTIRMVSAATGNITTIAGDGTPGYAGMGGPAVSSTIYYPNALDIDAAGNIYATDWYDDASFKIEATSAMITNICGHHSQGCSGDGGPGNLATMRTPGGIAVDHDGNVYMTDYGNNRIRRLDAATNIVTTIAGGPSTTEVDNGIPAIIAGFGQISGVCVDAYGNIYVSDRGNHIVRKIDVNTGLIRTVAGNRVSGSSGDGGNALDAELTAPGYLFMSNSGNLFIADEAANVIRVLDVNTGIIQTLVGTGSAGFSGDGGSPLAAQIRQPKGIWQDAVTGTIYIADAGNNRIRAITGSAYKTASGASGVTATTMNIFPNPSAGTLNIVLSSAPANATVDVMNVAGEKVFSQELTQLQTTITLDQPAGLYNVIVRSGGKTITQKVTISK